MARASLGAKSRRRRRSGRESLFWAIVALQQLAQRGWAWYSAAPDVGGIVLMTDVYERAVRLGLRAYKLTLSPLIGRQCRFTPSCSEYAADVLVGHGPVKGSWLALNRLCRCRPGAKWGYDPAPPGPRHAPRWKCQG